MYQVIKRDGRRVDFDLVRIANAITKAFDAAKIPTTQLSSTCLPCR